MTTRAVRLSDVAEAAGTSTKTASRVINGDPRVASETRARVQAEVERLGYRVDVMARTLRRGVDDAIGVVVPTIGDPFFASMLEEIERVALERDISILVASNSRDMSAERQVIDGLLARKVAGMVIAPYSADYGFLRTIRTPAVFIDRHPQGLATGVVLVDDYAEAQRAVQHLASFGHRRIALVVDALDIETSHLRRQGYHAALRDLGLEVDESLELIGCIDAAQSERRTRELLNSPNPPTAIFSARSETSLGVVRALHFSNRTDIALISFGDFVTADILKPAITVLDHNPRVLARIAMDRLIERLDGTNEDVASDIVVPLHLIPRGSGELPVTQTRGAVA
jgi:LacI family transcriptional regulator